MAIVSRILYDLLEVIGSEVFEGWTEGGTEGVGKDLFK